MEKKYPLPDYSENIKKLYNEISEEIWKIRPRTLRNLLILLQKIYSDFRFEYFALESYKDRIKYIMSHLEVSERTALDYMYSINIIEKIMKLNNYISKQITLIFKEEIMRRKFESKDK